MNIDWTEFLVNGVCGLCGNAGVVDKRGQLTPRGEPCGALHYCVCPNGRKLRELNAPKDAWLKSGSARCAECELARARGYLLCDAHADDVVESLRAVTLLRIPRP